MKLLDRFRKHDYSIEGLVEIGIPMRGDDGVFRPVQYIEFTCSKCGDIITLNRRQMKILPRSMSHGCPGK